MAQRVHAAVVTYNRGPLLVECLQALLAQSSPVAKVVVVDNASTDGTTDLLSENGLLDHAAVVYERLERNLGSSGGYSRAIALARDGADWIWIMDDDAEPTGPALERLLASRWAGDPGTIMLAQNVVNPSGSLQLGARGRFARRALALAPEEHVDGVELDFATFVGMLVRGETARATDPPLPEFFIWCDDYEWCLRLRRHGSIRLVPASEIVHKDVGHGFETRRSRLVNRLTGWTYGATPYAGFWRNACGARNWVWIRKTYFGESAPAAAFTVAQLIAKALLYDERPLARVPWLLRAGIDGRLGVFHNITPQEWAERLRSEGS